MEDVSGVSAVETPADVVTPEPDTGLVRDAQKLAKKLATLPFEEQVATLNAVRAILHAVSPFRAEPVDLVLWVPQASTHANDYNPNAVAPPEMRLLTESILADGYTQPVVTWPTGDTREIVDGFHRNRVGREVPAIRERVRSYLPVVTIRTERHALSDRMASTVRHNRARGEHTVESMSALVRSCYEAGWEDERIMKELGMDRDEVVRLKQLTGLAALFKDRAFSEAWEADLDAEDPAPDAP
jgi:ParB-like chromosome segregation protein Spo0J